METSKKTLYLMGTVIKLYLTSQGAEALIDEASKMLSRFEQVFSANSDTSPLANLKETAYKAPQKVDSDLFDLIKIGKTHSEAEDSLLNIAIGPLTKLWHIGFEDACVPSQEEIAAVLNLIKSENISLDEENETVFFKKKGMTIDLGAIAKGYFCDKVMAFFKENDAVSAMVDLGGNVLVYGDSPKGNAEWQVGIQNPFLPRGNLVASVSVRNQSVVTSGIYERTFEIDGKTYHHIFDSETGYPIETNIASLTIITNHSLDCDLYTTKFFGLDIRTILQKVNDIEGMAAIVITTDGRMAHTHNLKGKIHYSSV
ncbi:FAD:protein FMN transferase [Fusibacter ferrireducens]|uniref:FAD:protein FMN transferase n=1 Tax=Fusibacter ferrireducens TaxID=2785058 RepID=A0ABR9ZS94_9FIRM|nr:FAD:protein FMN transferase [Fusibacter ferrireducens]MBF4693329.1 FAD:protein FMN transferase [Fusibacter ferrireducens]